MEVRQILSVLHDRSSDRLLSVTVLLFGENPDVQYTLVVEDQAYHQAFIIDTLHEMEESDGDLEPVFLLPPGVLTENLLRSLPALVHPVLLSRYLVEQTPID